MLDFSIQHKIEEPLFKASSPRAKYAQKMCLYNLQYQQQILERNSFIIIFIFRFSPVEKIIRLDKIAWRLSIIYWVMIYWLRATIPVLGGDIIRFNNDTIFKDFPHDLLQVDNGSCWGHKSSRVIGFVLIFWLVTCYLLLLQEIFSKYNFNLIKRMQEVQKGKSKIINNSTDFKRRNLLQ